MCFLSYSFQKLRNQIILSPRSWYSTQILLDISIWRILFHIFIRIDLWSVLSRKLTDVSIQTFLWKLCIVQVHKSLEILSWVKSFEFALSSRSTCIWIIIGNICNFMVSKRIFIGCIIKFLVGWNFSFIDFYEFLSWRLMECSIVAYQMRLCILIPIQLSLWFKAWMRFLIWPSSLRLSIGLICVKIDYLFFFITLSCSILQIIHSPSNVSQVLFWSLSSSTRPSSLLNDWIWVNQSRALASGRRSLLCF